MDDATLGSDEETRRLISAELAQHEGLVRWVVRRQWLGDLSFQDALQEGRIGLWAALRHYDPQRGTAFSSYAVVAIAHAVWRAVARERRWAGSSPGPALCYAAQDSEPRADPQVQAVLREMLKQLPVRLREIVVAHHGLDGQPEQSFAAIGARLGVSRQRVQQLHGQALVWLAHPEHSLPLRQLLGRCRRQDYQRALARQHRLARQRRRRGER